MSESQEETESIGATPETVSMQVTEQIKGHSEQQVLESINKAIDDQDSDQSKEQNDKEREDQTSVQKPLDISFTCPVCKEARLSLIQCMHCGDRILESDHLNPYQRLLLQPKPLYKDTAVQAAKEQLLVMFHPLKASRLNAHWSLKQRALICHDARTLQSISGSLTTYANYLRVLRVHHGSELQTAQDFNYNQELPQITPRNLWALSGNINSTQQPFNTQLYLLKSAFDELQEYDSYQERERLFNQGMRSILNRARKLANQLYRYNFQKPNLDLDQLMPELYALQEFESWLEKQRLHQALKVKHDIAL